MRLCEKSSVDMAARRSFLMIGFAVAVAVAFVGIVFASARAAEADYPSKYIKLIVASAAGGPSDVLARVLANALSTELGQSVVVENRTGGGGITGFAVGASAAPDGYTLTVIDQAITVQPSLFKNLPYDIEKDFTPIALFVRGPAVLVVRKDLEANTLSDLVSLAKRDPGKLVYGSPGIGSIAELRTELFKLRNGLDIRHVPYRGGLPALMDLVAGRIDMMFSNVGTAKSQIDAGDVKAIAVGGKQRVAQLPNVPTFYEEGMPMPENDSGAWWGLMGPAKLPPQIQSKLYDAVDRALKNPRLLKQFDEMLAEPYLSTPKEFSDVISAERAVWGGVAEKANIKPE